MKKSSRKGWLKPIQWVDKPYTMYERLRELRVRECRQTAIAWPKRYYDSDTMKFDGSRIETIISYSIRDIMSESFYKAIYDNHYNQFYIPQFRPRDDFE